MTCKLTFYILIMMKIGANSFSQVYVEPFQKCESCPNNIFNFNLNRPQVDRNVMKVYSKSGH